MIIAKVIEAARDIHASYQSFGTTRQGTCPSHQIVQTQAKRGVESFDESGIDDAFFALCGFDQALHHFFAALNNTPVNSQDTIHTLFDDLNDGDIRPGGHLAATDFASPVRHFTSKSHPKGSDIT